MHTITWNTQVNAPCCPGEIIDDKTGDSILIQTDFDFPGVASSFGWSVTDVHGARGRQRICDHSGTDGTIDCLVCGMKAGEFIESARQWLEDHDGAQVEDPGYFTAE